MAHYLRAPHDPRRTGTGSGPGSPAVRAGTPDVTVELAKALLASAGYETRKSGTWARPRTSFGGFLKAVQDGDRRALEEAYHTGYASWPGGGVAKAALNESSGAAGGYAVPLEYTLALLEVISEESFIYPRAHVIPMERAETYVPRIDVETTPAVAGTSPFFGGVTFTWGSENLPAETEPSFRQMSLKAWDLLGYAVMSNQFLGDTGPAGEDCLIKLFGKAAAWYAEFSFLQGLGSGQQQPLGILNAPAAVTVARQTGNQISNKDIANMAATLLPYSWSGAIWAASPSCLGQIVQISNFFINGYDPDAHGNAGNLMTRPLFVTEKLASLGVQGDLILFDPWLYCIGLRQEVLIDVSPHPGFRNAQTNFRVWLRLDGRPQVSKPIVLQDKSTTVSPYVILK